MKSKYIVAIVAAGLIGSSMAAYGPAPKGKGCGKAAVADKFGNSVRSGAKSSLCWNDRISFSGVLSGRYTYTDNDSLEGSLGLDNELRLNHFALIADAQLDSKWSAHVTLADVHLEGTADDSTNNDVRFDEAMLYYKGDMPFDFKAGYGFVNFGEYNNPYDFVRNPTDVAATNRSAQIAAGFQIQDGLYGELFALGETEDTTHTTAGSDIGWGAAVGFDNKVGDVGVHSKVSYMANKNMDSLTYIHGGTYDVEVTFALPGGFKVGGAYVKSRGVEAGSDPLRLWSIDGAYRFTAAGMPSDIHGWYASNKETGSNVLTKGTATGGSYSNRFNLMKYDSARLDNIWSVGYGVQLSPNVNASFDYVSSDGVDAPSVGGREDVSDFKMFNFSLTGRF